MTDSFLLWGERCWLDPLESRESVGTFTADPHASFCRCMLTEGGCFMVCILQERLLHWAFKRALGQVVPQLLSRLLPVGSCSFEVAGISTRGAGGGLSSLGWEVGEQLPLLRVSH